ncbi:hypothetical protein M2122_000814 [Polynucleobacter sphagniphilus]|nr:hypothetical protein [Polynucleobacter sphagniphilus]
MELRKAPSKTVYAPHLPISATYTYEAKKARITALF